MLEYLHIRDFLFIEEATLELGKGLNVLTGESGAGKSFITKAILFLLGEKIASSFKENARGRPSVEGIFYTQDGELILRREYLVESGRSRFFINGTLTSQEVIHTIRSSLILYTSQHAQQKLLQSSFHTHILDTIAELQSLCSQKESVLHKLRLCKKKEEELIAKYIGFDEKRELLLYQQHLIEEVQPKENEEAELEEEKQAWKKDEKARNAIANILELLQNNDGSLKDYLQSLVQALEELTPYDTALENATLLVEQFHHCLQNIADAVQNIRASLPQYDIEAIESRLYALAQLKRTLRKSAHIDLATFASEIEETLSFLDACRIDLHQLNKQEVELAEELQDILTQINTKRREFAPKVSTILEKYLKPLGFSDALQISFDFTEHTVWDYSTTQAKKMHDIPHDDTIEIRCVEQKTRLLWTPHAGQDPLPLDSIASGGELSRIILAIYCLLAENTAQTLIFDEVDTGIGGATLRSVTERMQELAKQQQILLITHWPQMARCADKHFFVEKTSSNGLTKTTVKELNDAEKLKELKRMNMEE